MWTENRLLDTPIASHRSHPRHRRLHSRLFCFRLQSESGFMGMAGPYNPKSNHPISGPVSERHQELAQIVQTTVSFLIFM